MIEIDDLRSDIERVIERIDEMERAQMLANSRIRQDTNTIASIVSLTMLGIILMWSGVRWSNWFYLVPLVLAPFQLGWAISKVQEREEPRR